ncbi:hypothetical protein ABIC09_006429 [Bradyrhizobium sp. S3.12.5]
MLPCADRCADSGTQNEAWRVLSVMKANAHLLAMCQDVANTTLRTKTHDNSPPRACLTPATPHTGGLISRQRQCSAVSRPRRCPPGNIQSLSRRGRTRSTRPFRCLPPARGKRSSVRSIDQYAEKAFGKRDYFLDRHPVSGAGATKSRGRRHLDLWRGRTRRHGLYRLRNRRSDRASSRCTKKLRLGSSAGRPTNTMRLGLRWTPNSLPHTVQRKHRLRPQLDAAIGVGSKLAGRNSRGPRCWSN